MTTPQTILADELERLCCAETESKFFDCVTNNIDTIIAALRSPPGSEGALREAVINECINVKVILKNLGTRSDDWIRGFDAGTNAFIDALEKLRGLHVDYSEDVTAKQVSEIDELVKPEFEKGNWVMEGRREEIARVIDPDAFDGAFNGYISDLPRDEQDGLRANELEAQNHALTKADAIIELCAYPPVSRPDRRPIEDAGGNQS